MPLPAPDPTVLHPIAGQRREDVERLLRAAWWNWPIDLVTDHARAIMTGTAADLERIATEHGLRG